MTEHRSRLVVITSDVHGGGAEYALGSLATSSGEPLHTETTR